MTQPEPSVVKSAARTLEIFEDFDEVRRAAAIQEVAQALGYPHSSTGALLRSLEDLGYLEYSAEDKTFFPSIRVSLLGNWIEGETLPVRRLQRVMRDVAERTLLTVVLGSISGAHCQYLKVIQGSTPIRYHVKPGARRSLVRSTLGRVLLAQEPPFERAALIRRGLAAWEGLEPLPSEDDVARDVEGVAARGYAFNAGLAVPGAAMLAVPVRLDKPSRPLALGVAAPKEAFAGSRKTLLSVMHGALANLPEGSPVSGRTAA